MNLLERIQGSLIGGAVGDAFGLVAEFETPESIKEKYGVITEMMSGGWLGTERPGTVSDDTETLLCVLESLVECKGYNAHDMATRLVHWYNGDPIDIGHTTRAGLHRYAKTGFLIRPPDHDQAGNGALMRILPFAFIPDSDVDAIHHAHLTHNHKESDQAIKMYLWLVRQALQGKTKESMGVWGSYSGKSGGYVVETMDTVLHCFFTTTSFEDAIVLCCSLGHDSDTNCQILGGLAGAYYGCDSIPTRWTEALDQSIMQQLAGLSIGLQGVEVPR